MYITLHIVGPFVRVNKRGSARGGGNLIGPIDMGGYGRESIYHVTLKSDLLRIFSGLYVILGFNKHGWDY